MKNMKIMFFLLLSVLCLSNFSMAGNYLHFGTTLKDRNIISKNKLNVKEATVTLVEDSQKEMSTNIRRLSDQNEQDLGIYLSSEPIHQFKEEEEFVQSKTRLKRFSLNFGKWRRTNLTYKIMSYPPGIPKDDVRRELQRAYDVWSSFSDLTFTYKSKESNTELTIEFPAGKHHPNCHRDFDGRGNVLAHTFPPMMGGAMHFDPAETWTVNSTSGTDIFTVAVHEIGHSLGLSHSTHPESLMAPVYKPNEEYYYPSADDIEGIQEIYGPKRKIRAQSFVTDMRLLCDNFTYDTIFFSKQKERVYMFSGPNYWVVEGGNVKPGYPRRISEDWLGLPGDLDGAFTSTTGETYFFKKKKYWIYRGYRMTSGYPRLIRRGFSGVPSPINAVYETVNGKALYFLKGNKSWKYMKNQNRVVEVKYINETWSNLPSDVTAAFPGDDGCTYFFKENVYYKFQEDGLVVPASPEYPRSWQFWWLKCQNAQNETIMK